ncbi:hypothetical protein VNO77_21704 [Canavalia gladiata]|uniref:Uncharacterized protein n=1 Tax=Canavalia gladiata TaxID=3824 RepID=A0AAN9Q7E4_CANGL
MHVHRWSSTYRKSEVEKRVSTSLFKANSNLDCMPRAGLWSHPTRVASLHDTVGKLKMARMRRVRIYSPSWPCVAVHSRAIPMALLGERSALWLSFVEDGNDWWRSVFSSLPLASLPTPERLGRPELAGEFKIAKESTKLACTALIGHLESDPVTRC